MRFMVIILVIFVFLVEFTKPSKQKKTDCEKGKPVVYFTYNGKWATGELKRLGEKCFQ